MRKWRKWVWAYHEIVWGSQGCLGADDCMAPAACLYDGQPLCLDCADLLLERHLAIAERPELLTLLPPLWDYTPPETQKRTFVTMQQM